MAKLDNPTEYKKIEFSIDKPKFKSIKFNHPYLLDQEEVKNVKTQSNTLLSKYKKTNKRAKKINKFMREILKLTPQAGRNIVYGDDPNFKEILEEIEDTSRWSIHYRIIVRRLSDGKLFESGFRRGATESQDESPYEYQSEAVFKEVKPIERVVIDYGWTE